MCTSTPREVKRAMFASIPPSRAADRRCASPARRHRSSLRDCGSLSPSRKSHPISHSCPRLPRRCRKAARRGRPHAPSGKLVRCTSSTAPRIRCGLVVPDRGPQPSFFVFIHDIPREYLPTKMPGNSPDMILQQRAKSLGIAILGHPRRIRSSPHERMTPNLHSMRLSKSRPCHRPGGSRMSRELAE